MQETANTIKRYLEIKRQIEELKAEQKELVEDLAGKLGLTQGKLSRREHERFKKYKLDLPGLASLSNFAKSRQDLDKEFVLSCLTEEQKIDAYKEPSFWAEIKITPK